MMAYVRYRDVVVIFVVVCVVVDRCNSQNHCLSGVLTSQNMRANMLKSSLCSASVNLPATSKPVTTTTIPLHSTTRHIQTTIATVNMSTNASTAQTTTTVTPTQLPKSHTTSTTTTLKAKTSSPGTNNPGSSYPGTSNPGSNYPGTNNPGTNNPGSNNPGTNNPGTTSKQVTTTAASQTDHKSSPQKEKRDKRDLVYTVESPSCMIYKYLDTSSLFVTTNWTAEFSCDSAEICKDRQGCQDVSNMQLKGKPSHGYLCCCQGDDCNDPVRMLDMTDDQLYPGLQQCYTNSDNGTVKTSCKHEGSKFCVNVTKKEEISYHCSNAYYEKLCADNGMTSNGCSTGLIDGNEDMTVCCCNEDNCNFKIEKHELMFDYNIVIYVLSALIIVVLIITVVLLLARRKKTPLDPDMVQITYSRLTADLADA